jgi:Berberine and berberine like
MTRATTRRDAYSTRWLFRIERGPEVVRGWRDWADVKDAYDPANLFRVNQNIRASEEARMPVRQ